LCLYEYPGRSVPVVESFERLGRAVLDTLEPFPRRADLEHAARQEADATRLYPYLVPEGYLDKRADSAPTPRHLGHGLFLALAEDFGGVARILFPEDVVSLGAPEAVFEIARANLASALREQRVTIQGFEGPRGFPVMRFGSEPLAASCLVLDDLYAFGATHLGAGPLCASVPHRDAMLLFRREDAGYRREMRQLIAVNEEGAPKPLTDGLFTVNPKGIERMKSIGDDM